MRAILTPDIQADGVVTAVTASGRSIHLIGDPEGAWFVIEQPPLFGGESYFTAHRINAHPSIGQDVARFVALD